MQCRICKTEGEFPTYAVPDFRQKPRHQIPYFQCTACQTLQQVQPYAEPNDFYHPGYGNHRWRPASGFKRQLQKLRTLYAVYGQGWIGRWLDSRYPEPALQSLSHLRLNHTKHILDVGCGPGAVLHHLREIGFENLLGVDPYIAQSIRYGNGLEIRKTELTLVDGTWDVIMLHHVLEHVSDPLEMLQQVRQRLSPGGQCLIRTPVVPCAAWERYGIYWVQIDSPRHIHIFSVEALEHLAAQAGFTITAMHYDSTAFQFWGSEQYRAGIALESERSYAVNPRQSIFTDAQIQAYAWQATVLNQAAGQGDQAAFYLCLI